MRRRRGTAVVLGVVLLAASCSSVAGGSNRTLAKVDGWREELENAAPADVLELAYDAETARMMWDENVGDDLPVLDGRPHRPGIYGDLRDVDFDEEVVGLFSSGQSGSCTTWVDEIELDGRRNVAITTDEDLRGGDGCTDEYNLHRLLIVIDRDDVPDADALSTAIVIVDGNEGSDAVISEYPPPPPDGVTR